MSLPHRSKDDIPTTIHGSSTLPGLASINNNQSNNSIVSTNEHLEIKQSNASSGFAEDDNTSIDSKSGILPPIDSTIKILGPQKSVELSRQEKSIEICPCSNKPKTALKTSKRITVDTRCDITKPKPNSLPPITSTDGIPDYIDIKLQHSMRVKNAGKQNSKRSPRKRAKTHTIYKELNRGDSWELLKAEKIRCVELNKYEERLEAERQQKNTTDGKKYKKRNSEKKKSDKKLGHNKKHSESSMNDEDNKHTTNDNKEIKISKKKTRPVGRRNKNRKVTQSEESDDYEAPNVTY